MILRIILALLLWAATAQAAAPSFDAVTTATAHSTTTIGLTHAVGGGCTNTYLTAEFSWFSSADTVSSVVTTAGTMTSIDSQEAPNTYMLAMYGLAGPTGSQDVLVTFGTTVDTATLIVRSHCDVLQVNSLGTPAKAAGAGTLASVAVSSAAGELVIDAAQASTNTTGLLSVDGSQTERANLTDGLDFNEQGASEEAGAASVTMSWDIAASHYWAIIGVSLKPLATAAGTGGSVRRRF